MAVTYCNLGQVMKDLKMYTDALEMFERAQGLDPGDDEDFSGEIAWEIRDVNFELSVECELEKEMYERMWGTTEGYIRLS